MDKLFQQYTINEIAKKTHISPITLEKLKKLELDGITEIKLKGFIDILSSEYPNYDFSELQYFFKENAEIENNKNKNEQKEVKETDKILKNEFVKIEKNKNTKKNNKINLFLFLFVLLILITGLVYYLKTSQNIQKKDNKIIIENNKELKVDKKELKPKIEKKENKVEKLEVIKIKEKPKIEKIEKENIYKNEKIEENIVEVKEKIKDKKISFNNILKIEPQKLIWLRVFYFDNNSSKEYLTSNEIELNGSRPLFIKLGHGFVSILYRDKNITPNNKKIFRIILKDGNLEKTTKKLGEFLQ